MERRCRGSSRLCRPRGFSPPRACRFTAGTRRLRRASPRPWGVPPRLVVKARWLGPIARYYR
eukprot:1853994-Pyramimonas_sp.AAC.1